jgi:hypothetical protein
MPILKSLAWPDHRSETIIPLEASTINLYITEAAIK